MFYFRINTLFILFFCKILLKIKSLYNFGPLKNILFYNLFDFISGGRHFLFLFKIYLT